MARPRMENPEGGAYHVFARGNDRCLIFRDDADREMYLRRLEVVAERAGWKVLSYCLMGNHVHLVIETTEATLGWGMKLLHGPYAQAFNRRHGRVGHLFQGRFKSTVIEDDSHMCMAMRYVELNPVKAKLCRRPQDWPWSSCRALLTGIGARKFLAVQRVLAALDWLGGDPRKRYADLVEVPP